MATIENEPGGMTTEALRKMSVSQLLAQDLVQQGAVHAVSWLLANGCTEDNATAMLESLRTNAQAIRNEAKRRGKPSLFSNDQTAFS